MNLDARVEQAEKMEMSGRDKRLAPVKGVRGVLIDVDGCILTSRSHLDITDFLEFRAVCGHLRAQGRHIVLCSGRPGPFIEALAIALELPGPLLFEWGAGLTEDVAAGATVYHPALDERYYDARRSVVRYVKSTLIERYSCWMQPGKETAVTLFIRRGQRVDDIYADLSAFLHTTGICEYFALHRQDDHLDIRPRCVDKATGFAWFLQLSSSTVSPEHWLAIGDSIDDCPLFSFCGWGACPANADVNALFKARLVAPSQHIRGVLEILQAVSEGEA